MAEWFLRIKYLDVANRAYMPMLNSYHQFNNPIALAFKKCLFKLMGDKSLFFILSLGEGAKDPNIMETDCMERLRHIQVRNKFWVALTLMKHKKLYKYRKIFIQWKAEMKKLEESQKKNTEGKK